MLGIVIKLLDQRSYSVLVTSQTMLGIVIKLLDQRSYSHMF